MGYVTESRDTTEEVEDVIISMIDELTVEIILDQNLRVEKWKGLKYFLTQLPRNLRSEKEQNELMAMILTGVSCLDPYDTTFQDSKQSPSENLLENIPVPPLIYWSYDHWEALSDLVFRLMNTFDAQGDDILEAVMHTISLNQKLAKIRSLIEEQIITIGSGPVKIKEDEVIRFVKSIGKTNDDNQQELNNLILLENLMETDNNSTRKSIMLKELQHLNPILRSEPFEFRSFICKVDRLIVTWAWKFTPLLKDFHSKISEDRSVESAITECKKKIISGKGINTVDFEDDSPNSSAKKSDNERSQDRSLKVFKDSEGHAQGNLSRKSRATALNLNCHQSGVRILDEEEEESLDEQLNKIYKDDGNAGELHAMSKKHLGKRMRKRAYFTLEEKNAIEKGVAMFSSYGAWMWHKIKDHFPEYFAADEPRALEFILKKMVKDGVKFNDDIQGWLEIDSEMKDDECIKRQEMIQQSFPPHIQTKRRQRIPWTDKEKAAIREGIRQFGVSQWVKIRDKFHLILGNRTAVQIKDQYRTMCNRGEL